MTPLRRLLRRLRPRVVYWAVRARLERRVRLRDLGAALERSVWVSADGRRTHVTDMDVEHLWNARRYLARGALGHDVAAASRDSEFRSRWLSLLDAEIQRRGVDPRNNPAQVWHQVGWPRLAREVGR